MENFTDPVEEREFKKFAATKKRLAVLASVLVCAVVARIALKDPLPPRQPDHSQETFRAIPGILETLPESEKAKLTPHQIALLQEADRNATLSKPETTLAEAIYSPAEAPVPIVTEPPPAEPRYVTRPMERKPARLDPLDPVEIPKDTLVLFARGGYVKAQAASRWNGRVQIIIDRGMHADVPRKLVRSISHNALTWQQPIPRGSVAVRPAKGILFVAPPRVANRITLPKVGSDEI